MRDFHAEAARIWPLNGTSRQRGRRHALGSGAMWKMVPNGHLERAGDRPVARITGYTRQEERRRG